MIATYVITFQLLLPLKLCNIQYNSICILTFQKPIDEKTSQILKTAF